MDLNEQKSFSDEINTAWLKNHQILLQSMQKNFTYETVENVLVRMFRLNCSPFQNVNDVIKDVIGSVCFWVTAGNICCIVLMLVFVYPTVRISIQAETKFTISNFSFKHF